ncbi:MAG: hypothetical protein KUG78_05460 [Kangiellaceae bacterium]|nr:hypothetical protein [Kangiellaceae bacterium]
MSNKFDFDKIKKQLAITYSDARRKFVYLMDCINRFGFSGIAWWLKTHKQKDSFELALEILRSELEKQTVSLDVVEKTFADFIVPEDDMGHVYWYTDAHKKLCKFESALDKSKGFSVKLLQDAMNELKFIGQSKEFHQLYQLEAIQQRVNDMYHELQQKIIDQQSIERDKIEADKQRHVSEIARQEAEKAASIAKAKMMESVKVKEKRLAIIEEKKRQQAEKEAAELKITEQRELAETSAKEAERERQAKLQESYRELELKEKMKELPLEEIIEMAHSQIVNKKILTFIQLDQLSKLKQTIEDKKA